jgi:hypothetical protein
LAVRRRQQDHAKGNEITKTKLFSHPLSSKHRRPNQPAAAQTTTKDLLRNCMVHSSSRFFLGKKHYFVGSFVWQGKEQKFSCIYFSFSQ